jgi:hypothetical protein
MMASWLSPMYTNQSYRGRRCRCRVLQLRLEQSRLSIQASCISMSLILDRVRTKVNLVEWYVVGVLYIHQQPLPSRANRVSGSSCSFLPSPPPHFIFRDFQKSLPPCLDVERVGCNDWVSRGSMGSRRGRVWNLIRHHVTLDNSVSRICDGLATMGSKGTLVHIYMWTYSGSQYSIILWLVGSSSSSGSVPPGGYHIIIAPV